MASAETAAGPAFGNPPTCEQRLRCVWAWPGLLIPFVIAVPVAALLPRHWDESLRHLVTTGVGAGAAVTWWSLTFGRQGPSVLAVLGPRLNARTGALALRSSLGAMLFVLGSMALFMYFGGTRLRGPVRVEPPSNSLELWPTVATMASSALFDPITEELVFRGALFRKWRTSIGPLMAAVCSSLVFGVPHGDPIGSTLFGFVMVLLYVRTGTLWAPIAAHCFNNAVATGLQLIGVGALLSLGEQGLLIALAAATLLGFALLAGFVRRSWSSLGAALPPDARDEPSSSANAVQASAHLARVES